MIWVQQQIYNKMTEEEKNQGVQTSAWLKCCGETFRELCINKFLQTEAMLLRRVGQNSSTITWKTNKAIFSSL